MSRIVESFPFRGQKMQMVEPLVEELLDGKIHEFIRGEDWDATVSARVCRPRLQAYATQQGFKTKTAVRGDRIYAQIIGEVGTDG